MTLTVPIEIGKKYVRRDGVVVTVKPSHPSYRGPVAYTGDEESAPMRAGVHIWLESGVLYGGESSPLDLVADYIEPAKAIGHPHAARMAEEEITVYFNQYGPESFGGVFASRAEAEAAAVSSPAFMKLHSVTIKV